MTRLTAAVALLLGVGPCSKEEKPPELPPTPIDGGWHEIARMTCDGQWFVPEEPIPQFDISPDSVFIRTKEPFESYIGDRYPLTIDVEAKTVKVGIIDWRGTYHWEVEDRVDHITKQPYKELVIQTKTTNSRFICGHRFSNGPIQPLKPTKPARPPEPNPLIGTWTVKIFLCDDPEDLAPTESPHIISYGLDSGIDEITFTDHEFFIKWRSRSAPDLTIHNHGTYSLDFENNTIQIFYTDGVPLGVDPVGTFEVKAYSEIRLLDMSLGRLDPDPKEPGTICGHELRPKPPEKSKLR